MFFMQTHLKILQNGKEQETLPALPVRPHQMSPLPNEEDDPRTYYHIAVVRDFSVLQIHVFRFDMPTRRSCFNCRELTINV